MLSRATGRRPPRPPVSLASLRAAISAQAATSTTRQVRTNVAATTAAAAHIPRSSYDTPALMTRRYFVSSSNNATTTTTTTDKRRGVEAHPFPSKVLIANRGEIACRVMRTCKRLGIATVAVFSEADSNAAHVRLADEAYCIGPAPSAESYLKMDTILEVARRSGAEMIHPGYGFLSENSSFASLLEASDGIRFIGPPSQAIISMGSKSASKDIMTKAGVPCVPGYHGQDQSDANLQAEADKIGYPVLIKAVKGGGGKGMKIVEKSQDFLDQLRSAQREAEKSFGDADVLIERYLKRPRHVEVQVVSSASPHNQHLAISTRDCSVQRRHQKIIEEAPAPHLSAALEQDLCDKATAAARAVNYVGAGTVEFIMDADTGDFFFMEMNTRLQVEHCVSEMISGIDLVEWQLLAASGNPLPLSQSDIKSWGHSFEARIYAEDTEANFLPDVGVLSHVAFPTPTTDLLTPSPPSLSSSGIDAAAPPSSVRIDTGFGAGDEISVHYDPMIAKLIVHGRDRSDALRLMRKALGETQIVGPKTNVGFLSRLCAHDAFIDGQGLETGFIAKYGQDLFLHGSGGKEGKGRHDVEISEGVYVQAAVQLAWKDIQERREGPTSSGPWTQSEFSSFRSTRSQEPRLQYKLRKRRARQGQEGTAKKDDEEVVTVHVQPHSSNQCTVVVEKGEDSRRSFGTVEIARCEGTEIELRRPSAEGGNSVRGHIVSREPGPSDDASTAARLDVFSDAKHYELDLVAPAWLEEVKGALTPQQGSVRAPMPSKVVEVRCKPGDAVKQGDIVVVLEAMKTEHTLRAPNDGIVAKVNATKGAMCAEGTELVTFEEAAKDDES